MIEVVEMTLTCWWHASCALIGSLYGSSVEHWSPWLPSPSHQAGF